MAARTRSEAGDAPGRQEFHRIEFETMLKGAILRRGKQTIRQIGVTVAGSTRLVTSGDIVDQETYEALLAVGAVRPVAPVSATASDFTLRARKAPVAQPPLEE